MNRTPAGKECKYFYGDYRRGRSHEECRLLEPALAWTSKLCFTCPVPGIQNANACEHMRLTPRLERPYLIGKPRVAIDAYCTKCACPVAEPRVGCGQCHTLPEVFVFNDDTDASS